VWQADSRSRLVAAGGWPFPAIKPLAGADDSSAMEKDIPRKEKRAFAREKLRAPCEFSATGETGTGFLLNISPRGMFLQTRTRMPPGTELEIRVRDLGPEPFTLHARVVHRTNAHRATSPVETGGMGLELTSAPEAFYQVLYALGVEH
jgi:hypothetical protein